MPAPASSPVMVGRQAQLETLLGILATGREGRPGAAVVRGEAGIGKSRLIAELLGAAPSPGFDGPPVVVAVGQCVDLGPIGAPFTPMRSLLRDLVAALGADTVREAAGSPIVASALAALVPELAASDAPAGAVDAADQVAEAIERVIERLSVDHHLVLVIEDLHWADAATLALLKTLALTLRARHFTLVMSYRTDDVGRDHPLRPVLSELERSRAIAGISLDRLTPDQIGTQIGEITGAIPRPEQLTRIAERSDGVPFLVEELLALDDRPLPESLRDLVLARFERLSRQAKSVVGIAAVGGVGVPDDLLAEVVGIPRSDLDAALREAIDAQVLVGAGDGYAFRHSLIREAVYAQLLVGERRAHHRRYAEACAHRDDLAAEAAEHWLAAGDDARAFDATARAYRDAVQRLAPATAARFGERLLTLWDAASDPVATAGSTRAALAADVVDILESIGDPEPGPRIVELGLRDDDADPLVTARLLLSLSACRSAFGDYTSGREASARAESLLRGTEGPEAQRLLALSISGRMISPESTGRGWSGWEEDASEALELADAAGDPDTRFRVLRRIGWAHLAAAEVPQAIEVYREIERDSPPGATRFVSLCNLTDLLTRTGRYDEAIAIATAGEAECAEWGVERGHGSLIGANRVDALIKSGRPLEGLALAERVQALLGADELFRSFVVRTMAEVSLWSGVPDEADAVITRLGVNRDAVGEDHDEMLGWARFSALAKLLAAESATPDDRASLIGAALDDLEPLTSIEAAETPGFRVQVLPVAAWALAAASVSGVAHDALVPVRAVVEKDAAKLEGEGPPALYRALIAAELARADGADAAELLNLWREAARVGDERTSPRVMAHYAAYRLLQQLIDTGARDQASAVLDRLVAEAPGEGAAAVARWAEELGERAGLATPSDPGDLPALTPRERQVLDLVAEGLTNRQIGERLFISPKTASVHVSAILAKVGAANRTEAAAIASHLRTASEER